MKLFADRHEAGRALAHQLRPYEGRPDVIVLALPRGGVPVGYEVAMALHVPLEVFTVRKLGAPWNPEFAVGALASGGIFHIEEDSMYQLGLLLSDLDEVIAREQVELARRDALYRGSRPFPNLQGMTVIVVDDGLATGSTMQAAVKALREQHPARVIAAAPVASPEACEMLKQVADDTACTATPEPFYGVGMWYEDFSETSDAEVMSLLRRAATAQPQPSGL